VPGDLDWPRSIVSRSRATELELVALRIADQLGSIRVRGSLHGEPELDQEGVGAVLLGISLRRERLAPGWLITLLIVAGVLCVPPLLPARYTLVAVAALLVKREPTPT
jgi:hypothetical protein